MKYLELQQQLIELILSDNSMEAGGKFLSERQICDVFNVSRTTARKAVTGLCQQGYLVQKHGRGTFIKNPAQSMPIDVTMHMAQTYSEMGYHPRIIVLKKERIPANRTVAKHLEITPGEDVLTVEKLYMADRILLNETIAFLPITRFPKLMSIDYSTQNPMDAYTELYGIHSKQHFNSIEAIHPPQDIANNLKISVKTPILLFENTISSVVEARIQPLAYFKTYYRTDRFRFSYVLETHT